MRLKIKTINSRDLINISEINLRFAGNLPKFSFKCHRKFEDALFGAPVKFVNSKGQEILRSAGCYLTFRYYEADGQKPKVLFETAPLECRDYGYISRSYAEKILQQVSNKLYRFKEPESPSEETYYPPTFGVGLWQYFLRFLSNKATKLNAKLIQKRKIFSIILPKIINSVIISRAPT